MREFGIALVIGLVIASGALWLVLGRSEPGESSIGDGGNSNRRFDRPVDASSNGDEAARATAGAADSALRPQTGSTKEPPTDEASVDPPPDSKAPGAADEVGPTAQEEGAAAGNPEPRPKPAEDARVKKDKKEEPRTRYVGWAWDAVYAELGSPDFCRAGEWWYQGRDGEPGTRLLFAHGFVVENLALDPDWKRPPGEER